MRLFYVRGVRKYIFITAIIFFAAALILQFIPSVFMQEILVFAQIKTKLGYPITFFHNNTLLLLRILFSFFYAFIGGICGFLYFRLKHQKSGHTLFFTNGFKILSGIYILSVSYALLNSEKIIINPIALPKISIKSDFANFLNMNLSPFLTPRIKTGPSPIRRNSSPMSNNIPLPKNNQSMANPTQPPNRQATAQELFAQLNSYRVRNGRTALIWDNELGDYAQNRANLYAHLKSTDQHTGFRNDMTNDLHHKLFFFGLGENSSFGRVGDAKYIIEEYFGRSPAHNEAQLSIDWSHVGIAVNGEAININFGGGKTDSFHVEQ